MFRRFTSRAVAELTFPHARGDVPEIKPRLPQFSVFSPRPWGCSAGIRQRRRKPRLFPTPVGMFRCSVEMDERSGSFPHARGDVPWGPWYVHFDTIFSPRPWGCSDRPVEAVSAQDLFPTPVGMFRRSAGRIRARRTFPHARGDVPHYDPAQGGPRRVAPRKRRVN